MHRSVQLGLCRKGRNLVRNGVKHSAGRGVYDLVRVPRETYGARNASLFKSFPSSRQGHDENGFINPVEDLPHIKAGIAHQPNRLGCRQGIDIEDAFLPKSFLYLRTDAAKLAKRNQARLRDRRWRADLKKLGGGLFDRGNHPPRSESRKEKDNARAPPTGVRRLGLYSPQEGDRSR